MNRSKFARLDVQLNNTFLFLDGFSDATVYPGDICLMM